MTPKLRKYGLLPLGLLALWPSLPAKAGHYVIDYSGSRTGHLNGVSDTFTHDPGGPYAPYGSAIGSGTNIQAACSMSVSATLSWTPDFAGDTSAPPAFVKVNEYAYAGGSTIKCDPAGTVTVNDGLGDSDDNQVLPYYPPAPGVPMVTSKTTINVSTCNHFRTLTGAPIITMPVRNLNAVCAWSGGNSFQKSNKVFYGVSIAEDNVQTKVNGVDTTNQTVQVYAGQPVTVTAVPPAGASAGRWSFSGGYPIKSYSADSTIATTTFIPDSDFNQTSMNLFFTKKETIIATYTCQAPVNGVTQACTGTTTISVWKPGSNLTAAFSPIYGQVSPDNLATVWFGNPVPGVRNGVIIKATFAPNMSVGGVSQPTIGSYDWVQILHTYNVSSGGAPVSSLSMPYADSLDTSYTYGLPGQNFIDSPHVTAPAGASGNDVQLDYSASAYLLWKSPIAGSIFVPMSRLDWGGSGRFTMPSTITGSIGQYSTQNDLFTMPIWSTTFAGKG